MKRIFVLFVMIGSSLFFNGTGFSQTTRELSDLKREIEALKNGQTAIQRDLAEIKNLLLQREVQNLRDSLQGRPAAPSAPAQAQAPAAETVTVVSIDGGAVKGEQNAKLTLVEFTDYQCPFCSRHYRETMPKIVDEYVKTGKVKYVLREFPLESIHRQAVKAAEAATCSGEQGKYWEMHSLLFSNQKAMTIKDFVDHAQGLGLDSAKFLQCVDSGKYTAKVRKDLNDAQKAGATGTPTFYLGLTDPKSAEVKTVRKLVGAQPYAAFKDAIDALLAAK
jgi:protein-disulfide isomerase